MALDDPSAWQHTLAVPVGARVQMCRMRPLKMGGWTTITGRTTMWNGEVIIAMDEVERIEIHEDPPEMPTGTAMWRFIGSVADIPWIDPTNAP